MKKHVYTIILLLLSIMAENQLSIQLKIFQSGDKPEEIQPALLHSSARFSIDEGFVCSWKSNNKQLSKELKKKTIGLKECVTRFFHQHFSGIQVTQKNFLVEINVCLREVSCLNYQI